jgi:S1-C subfamily serine protease
VRTLKNILLSLIPVLFIVVVINGYILNENTKKPSFNYLQSVSVKVIVENPITNEGWSGSGIIVKETKDFTYILTNRHVAPFEQDNYVYVYNGVDNMKPATVLKNSVGEYIDLSLIRIQGRLTNKQPVKGLRNANIQDRVFTVGCNGGKLFVYREGVIATKILESYYVQIPVRGGDSGSGIVDKNGYLVGVIYALELDAGYFMGYPVVAVPNHTIAVAMTYNELQKFLKEEI